jgi:hypothetical protein
MKNDIGKVALRIGFGKLIGKRGLERTFKRGSAQPTHRVYD